MRTARWRVVYNVMLISAKKSRKGQHLLRLNVFRGRCDFSIPLQMFFMRIMYIPGCCQDDTCTHCPQALVFSAPAHEAYWLRCDFSPWNASWCCIPDDREKDESLCTPLDLVFVRRFVSGPTTRVVFFRRLRLEPRLSGISCIIQPISRKRSTSSSWPTQNVSRNLQATSTNLAGHEFATARSATIHGDVTIRGSVDVECQCAAWCPGRVCLG